MVEFAPLAAAKIVEAVGGTVVRGELAGQEFVRQLGEPSSVGAEAVTFLISESFLKDLASTKASIVVLQAALIEKALAVLPPTVKLAISSRDAYLGLAQLSKVIAESDPFFDWAFVEARTTSPVHPTAKIDPTARVAPGAVVGERAEIGPRTVLLPNSVVGPKATLGADCVLFPGAVIYPRVVIGNRVRIHANSVIGSDGFGYARGPMGSVKIWHLGRVLIGDDVEVGAGTTIDRGTMKDTIVERGAKLDNLVQVGHNGHIRAHAILCAQVGLAGNVTVGQGVILAGQAGVADKVTIADGSVIGPQTGLSKDTNPGDVIMSAIPGKLKREWWRTLALIDRLPDLFERIKKLEGGRK